MKGIKRSEVNELETKKFNSSVEQKFNEMLNKQNSKGMEKYGQSLNPLDSRYDWLEMAIEEQIDGFQYLHAEQIKRNFIIEEIKAVMTRKVHPQIYGKVVELLEEMRGRS